MPRAVDAPRVIVELDESGWVRHLAEQTRAGLQSKPAWIPPVWFYDERGSKLFSEITTLDEYYPTNAEREILADRADDVAAITGADILIELGAGTSEKTGVLLHSFDRGGTLACFVPVDVSRETLEASARRFGQEFPTLAVDAIVADFTQSLRSLPTGGRRIVAFLGSTIGNFEPEQRASFLANLSDSLQEGDWLLLGTDLVKSPDRLIRAYNDSRGVTAQFNLNALRVLNRTAGANFELDAFVHEAVWDEREERIEMRLVAQRPQQVTLSELENVSLTLATGEWIRTEISTKFTQEKVRSELQSAGFAVARCWTDERGDYLLTLAAKRSTR